MIKKFEQYIKEDFEDDDMECECEEDESLETTGAKYGDKVICIRDTISDRSKFSKRGIVIKKGEIKKVLGGTVTMMNSFPMKINYFTVWFGIGEGVYPGKDFRLL